MKTYIHNLAGLLAAAASLLFSAGALASETRTMTLRECMEYAVENSTKLRVSSTERDDEQALRRQRIFEAFTPSASASTYAYDQFGRNIDPETNTYTSTTSFHNGYQINGGIVLFDGFKAVNNIRIAQTGVRMGLSRDELLRDEVCLATMEAFCNVLYYTELETVLKEQVSTAETILRKAEREEEMGMKGHADVVQMKSELAKKEYSLVNITNKRKDAMLTLKDVMFFPPEDELVLADSVIAPEDDMSLDVVLENARTSHPKVEIAALELESARLALKNSRWSYSPTLSLYAGWSTNYFTYPGKEGYTPAPYRDQFRNNGGEYIQFGLSIPIFDRMKKRSDITRSRNAYERAGILMDRAIRDVENEVHRAVNDRDGAEAALLQAERLADVEKEAFNLNSKRFETGLISSIEYQTASENYLNAVAECLGARYKYMIAESVVRYYDGIPYLAQ